MSKTIITFLTWCAVLCCAAALSSCGSSDVTQSLSAGERFELGKKKFAGEDYLEAISQFEIVKLQFPGSTVADSAQFYLGECHYRQEEYLIAAEEYQALKRNMQASPLVPMAQYKIAMCYYNLSPDSPMDQAYTRRAIDEFQSFLEYYPSHEFARDASDKIVLLNTKLARKLYDTGRLYLKMEYYKSATIYFSAVVEKYHDTEFAEPALLGKVKALIPRKRYDEAKTEIDRFLQKYPESRMKSEAESLARDIDEGLKSRTASPGSTTQ
ncbi:MAG TPA: outer membrane protein assembly factor BamD [Bacteroidota bacterium]|nr:outer membrane protein assembly factor BamD [Bacteroidota bacterium]